LSPNANPGKGSVGGLYNWMPKATARIQRAAQTHSHLSSTRSVIPNGSGLCKGGIKKVTGGWRRDFDLVERQAVLARPSPRVCGIIRVWRTSGRIAGEKSLVMPSPVELTLRKPGRVRQPKSWWRKSGRRTQFFRLIDFRCGSPQPDVVRVVSWRYESEDFHHTVERSAHRN
jgi:hypothetical protein